MIEITENLYLVKKQGKVYFCESMHEISTEAVKFVNATAQYGQPNFSDFTAWEMIISTGKWRKVTNSKFWDRVASHMLRQSEGLG